MIALLKWPLLLAFIALTFSLVWLALTVTSYLWRLFWPELRVYFHRRRTTCQRCNGLGQVFTNAIDDEWAWRFCEPCYGTGRPKGATPPRCAEHDEPAVYERPGEGVRMCRRCVMWIVSGGYRK